MKNDFPCPCGGKIKWKKERVIQEGVDCGMLDIEYCEQCGEEYFPEESLAIIETKLKENGLWGVSRREVKFWRSAGSVIIRLPKEFAKKIKSPKGFLYQEGEHKLAIEY